MPNSLHTFSTVMELPIAEVALNINCVMQVATKLSCTNRLMLFRDLTRYLSNPKCCLASRKAVHVSDSIYSLAQSDTLKGSRRRRWCLSPADRFRWGAR